MAARYLTEMLTTDALDAQRTAYGRTDQVRGAAEVDALGPQTLAFADLKGNRQLLSTGNVAAVDRVSMFLIDYPQRVRLKLMGHARTVDARVDAALADQVSPSPALRARIERVFVIDVVGFDWNCPAYITPRYTAAEVDEVAAPLRARIDELEAQLAAARSSLERSTRG